MVSKQVDYAESDKLISFYVRESWKILNFNYVSYHCTSILSPNHMLTPYDMNAGEHPKKEIRQYHIILT